MLQADPFKSLDDVAVGSLVRSGINKCREVKFNMDCSIVDGDHTSDPRYCSCASWGIRICLCFYTYPCLLQLT